MGLAGKTLFITGSSRGIGKAIALRCARDGANIAIVAKTITPFRTLPGTIYQTAHEVEQAGGKALPLAVDIRDEHAISQAVVATLDRFGGIDILVNNAGAIDLEHFLMINPRKIDLLLDINIRGTQLCIRECAPYLVASAEAGRCPHILNISPPLNMNPKWFAENPTYTISKYAMSMFVLGMAQTPYFRNRVSVNALWPRKVIATSALRMLPHADPQRCRKPEIMADAAHAIFQWPATCTGNFFIDEQVLRQKGITDFDRYAVVPGTPDDQLLDDLFLD